MGPASDTNREFTHIALVDSLQEALGEDFKKLSKLVLIACNLSYGPEMLKEHVHGKTVEEISAYKNGAGYLLLAMLRLSPSPRPRFSPRLFLPVTPSPVLPLLLLPSPDP
jgi:hypothetical protein